jgi:hypothetical protein
MTNIFNSPIVHGLVAAGLFALGWFLTSGNPILTLTIGAVLKMLYSWLANYAD